MIADTNTNTKSSIHSQRTIYFIQVIEYISRIYHTILPPYSKNVRLNSTHYLIMKVHNITELQHIAINYEYFMETL